MEKKFCFNLFKENTRIFWKDRTDAVVVDPGMYDDREEKEFDDFCTSEGITPRTVILTHGHMDHMGGVVHVLSKWDCKVYMHPEDRRFASFNAEFSKKLGLHTPDFSFESIPVADNCIIEAGGYRFKVITTPGHSPGSVCYLEETERMLLSGDTLFAGTIGRSDLQWGDYDSEILSIMEKLMRLDSDIAVLPGHGPDSTIGEERLTNPFLVPFNEKEEIFSDDLEGVEIHG